MKTKKPSKPSDSATTEPVATDLETTSRQKTDEKPVGVSAADEQAGSGDFPGITVEQLDEMLEERQGGDRRKSDQAVDFPDRRVSNRRKKDKSADKTE